MSAGLISKGKKLLLRRTSTHTLTALSKFCLSRLNQFSEYVNSNACDSSSKRTRTTTAKVREGHRQCPRFTSLCRGVSSAVSLSPGVRAARRGRGSRTLSPRAGAEGGPVCPCGTEPPHSDERTPSARALGKLRMKPPYTRALPRTHWLEQPLHHVPEARGSQ